MAGELSKALREEEEDIEHSAEMRVGQYVEIRNAYFDHLYDATRHTFATTAAELEVPLNVRRLLWGKRSARMRTTDTCTRPECS